MALAAFRYLGTNTTIVTPDLSHSLSIFGQTFEVDQETAEDLVLNHRAPLLPENLFAPIGFSTEELDDNPSVLAHELASPTFLVKRDAAWKALSDYRLSLSTRKQPAAPEKPAQPQAEVPTPVAPAPAAVPEAQPQAAAPAEAKEEEPTK